ncbi:hypothetical protein F2P56_017368 [Juglans regia]|uniref:Uncharacterized protein n=1 Tax=Juglans regia TaxID=51240 RepID=A0A833XHW7_JUGRE|nr:hypothetical protein F2P56_017368 [Juglans regia]
MSEPMVRVIRGGLVRLIHYSQLSKSIRSPSSSSNPNYAFASSVRAYSSSLSPVNSRTSMISQFHSRPTSSNAVSPNTSSLSTRSLLFFTIKPAHSPISGAGFGVRLFSMNPNLGKRVFWDKPATALTSTFSRYREAIGLQIEAFFRRNSLILIGAGGLLVCALLWRIMFGIASTFVGLSEGMAKYGFLALSSAIVAFAKAILINHTTFVVAAMNGPIRALLLCFEAVTGLKVNLGKSEMVAVGEVPHISLLADMLGCEVSSLPMKYLDLSLGATFKARDIWEGVIERVEKQFGGNGCIYRREGDLH